MRGRRMNSRRFMVSGILLLMLPVSVAHLAQSTVETSYAGQTTLEVDLTEPTRLTAPTGKVNLAHEGKYQFLAMKAVLTSGSGDPISGATVVFKVAGHPVCTTQTHTQGQANCESNEQFARDLFGPPHCADPTTYPFVAEFSGFGVWEVSTSIVSHLEKDVGNDAGGCVPPSEEIASID